MASGEQNRVPLSDLPAAVVEHLTIKDPKADTDL
jgi:hypothetical protein